jgi:hypothetical protein
MKNTAKLILCIFTSLKLKLTMQRHKLGNAEFLGGKHYVRNINRNGKQGS